jgi:predicted DNA-binding ribbon-helix-helix protein
MKSSVVKHSIVIAGHRTSVSLEGPFWRELKDIAHHQYTTLSNLVGTIEAGRKQSNLSSALRLFVLEHVRSQPIELSEDRVGATKLNGNQPNHM